MSLLPLFWLTVGGGTSFGVYACFADGLRLKDLPALVIMAVLGFLCCLSFIRYAIISTEGWFRRCRYCAGRGSFGD